MAHQAVKLCAALRAVWLEQRVWPDPQRWLPHIRLEQFVILVVVLAAKAVDLPYPKRIVAPLQWHQVCPGEG